ncbi:hypothetical protein [Mesobacillus zeae]|uniref:Phage tail protein n=1 Tax=Mesobacillus zeae TaxID=1917180 RepID=A0A398BDL5_9BACI|nr:hypothetical protein [Mesobacillus zeae]RID85673.1 hypothetical protein D1970_08955 [Mesobacillus zeae]
MAIEQVKTIGYNASVPDHLLLDAGAIYKNVTYAEATGIFSGEALGATQGGNEFSYSQEIRPIPIDGVKGRVKGLQVVDSEEAVLTVNLLEQTAANLKLAIAGSTLTSDTNYDVITPKGKIEATDYLDNIAYVGRVSGSSKPVVIILENALSIEGLNLKPEDKKEAVLPIKFAAHIGPDEATTGVLPVKIYFPKATV